eukprot:symbB.v1.2.011457.t1/scaffold713.1/size170176/6
MTPAKRCLKLSSKVSKLLTDLGHCTKPPEESLDDRSARLQEIREGDAVRWQLFCNEVAYNEDFQVDAETVPFPRGPDDNILALPDSYTPEQAQKAIAEALVRWHPDKFLGLHQTRLTSDKHLCKCLHNELARVTRALLQMRKDYSLGGEGEARETECGICMQEPDGSNALLTTGCCKKQRICQSCYDLIVRGEQPRCPFCRAHSFKAKVLTIADMNRRPRQRQPFILRNRSRIR